MHFFSSFWSESLYHTLPRKISISQTKTLIYGPPRSGKTSLAIDYAQNLNLPSKSIIYINLRDLRISHDEARQELLKLYLEKKIQLLIIDHYQPSFILPNLNSILLISEEKLSLPSFTAQFCPALSFVEYISLHSKTTSIDSMLKNFIKDGNLPQTLSIPEHQKLQAKQELLQRKLDSNLSLFTKLIPFQAQKITSFQFYTMLKKTEKISKDKVYALIQDLSAKGLIFFVPHIQANKPKKLYFYDFSLPKAFISNPMIVPILENMFVLELLSLGDGLCYDDLGFFILPSLGNFLFAPFAQREGIEKKLDKIAPSCPPQIKIITLDFADSGTTQGVAWEALSFIEFALGEIE